ncbi:MAG: cysteine desulfurase-like protein [Rhizobiales bacterium]|nr:cysteine desulfurase-like protein [Hyphomicrobiales bacterium]
MAEHFDIEQVRDQFPALAITDNGTARVYLDNPAGTQVPQRVIDRMISVMTETNANLGGFFTTTLEAEKVVDEAHRAMAAFYNAASAREIIFGQSMTALTLHMSRCLAKGFRAGDEIVLSRMDHDGNVAPWLLVADDIGMTVRWIDFDPETFEFADDALDKVLSDKTRLVAVGAASNCTGTVNDIAALCVKARAAGALSYIDAVQFAPHRVIDVEAFGCDFLVSSPYKFFGPHQGVLWGREELLEETFAYQVRPAQKALPDRFELGSSPRESLAGTLGAVEYIASHGGKAGHERSHIVAGMERLDAWEKQLTGRLIAGLQTVKGVKIQGITSANAAHRRVPTVSIIHDDHHPEPMAKALAAKNIFVWSGHNYALEPVKRLGLLDKGGVLRIGLAHYNTEAEVDQCIAAVDGL